MSERLIEIGFDKKKFGQPEDASDFILDKLSRTIPSGESIGDVPYSRPRKVGFNTSLLDSGPTLSDLLDEEYEKESGSEEHRVGFLNALQSPERSVRTWLVGFWREPAVMFLFDHQKDFLVDEEARKLGAISMDLIKIVNRVNGKFKDIVKKMGGEDVGDPFSIVASEDDASVRIEVEKDQFKKMIVAIQNSDFFSLEEKNELTNFIEKYIGE